MDSSGMAAAIRENGIRWVRMEGTDLDGVVRTKRVSGDRFLASLSGTPVTEILFSQSLVEEYDARLRGPWVEGVFGDILMVPDLDTFAAVPWEDGVAAVMCDWKSVTGEPVAAAPRTVLASQVERLGALGFSALAAAEYELFLYRETPDSARAKQWRNLEPLFHGRRTLDAATSAVVTAAIGDVVELIGAYGIPVEEVKVESAASQIELNLSPAPVLESCDRAVRLKLALRELLRPRGLLPVFLARPPGVEYGSSCHFHVSLWDESMETPLFWDAERSDGMSDLFRHAVGGLVETMVPLTTLFCPTVNSGKRLRDYAATPTVVAWGGDNKSVAVRTLARTPAATRLEHRLGGADANPYLIAAAVLAGVVHGIQEGVDPPVPAGMAWGRGKEGLQPLPRTLRAAVAAMEASPLPAKLFDPVFVDHFTASRHVEIEKFDEAVTDWELERYADRL